MCYIIAVRTDFGDEKHHYTLRYSSFEGTDGSVQEAIEFRPPGMPVFGLVEIRKHPDSGKPKLHAVTLSWTSMWAWSSFVANEVIQSLAELIGCPPSDLSDNFLSALTDVPEFLDHIDEFECGHWLQREELRSDWILENAYASMTLPSKQELTEGFPFTPDAIPEMPIWFEDFRDDVTARYLVATAPVPCPCHV
jgi:hypothetical protein